MDETWQKVREIFDAALRQKLKDRRKFVNEACGDDKTLLAEVESLLSSHEGAESFLETPAVAKVADFAEAETKKLERGKCFNQYEIIKQIGAGGMGEVYLAEDKKLDRKVAVKILNEKFSRDESNLKRFVQEAKAASALNHPNILVIHEIGESEEAHYIVSEFINGKTLRDILQEKSSPKLSEILDIAVQIAGALAVAHEARLAHRDIKPENVMIRPDGFVKVLDFGLAKLVEQKNKSVLGLEDSTGAPNQTAKGVILGTVNYMSPEQAKGERVDERTDIFSLGIVIYEMLAGRTPFAGDSMSETFANLINSEPPPLARFSSNAPQELQRIVSKMLRKEKDERYQTMKDVLTDLRDLRENLSLNEKLERSAASSGGQATQVLGTKTGDANIQTTETPHSFLRQIERHKPLAAFAFLILLVGAIALGYFFYAGAKNAIIGGKKSIAVLPVKPINQANRDELYEIGIADSLIQRLGLFKNFAVRPLNAIRKYADINQDPIAAGREQQVDYVLASNYQIANGKIRVTSQLLNVESGQIEETYKTEKDASDVFSMQDTVANEVGNLLQSHFAVASGTPANKRGTDNEEAYRLYLQGVYFNDKRFPSDGEKAVEYFEQAVKVDPNYARAWAGVAFAHRSLIDIGADVDPAREHRISMEAVNRALALDPNLSEAYNALCLNKLNYEYDFDGAETACRRAIELDPNYPVAHNTYARLLFSSGRKRFDEAIAEIKTAIDLDPTSFYHQIVYTVALTYARRYDEAVQQLDRLAQRNPKNAVFYFWLVGGVAFQGREAEDFERLTRFEKLAETDEETIKIFKDAYQTDGWRGVLREQAKMSALRNANLYFTATVYAQMGDKDKAIEYLEKTFQRREHWMAYLEVDPRLDSLRGDARFDDLVRRVESR